MTAQTMHPDGRAEVVGLVGLGLIGGSLGLDLRARGWDVRGLVRRESTAERARQRGLAGRVSTDPSVLDGCRLVVLALPLDQLLAPDPVLLAALPPDTVITDVGSVKAPVLRAWQGIVPRFVASHPMAGTADAGVEAGVRHLFRGRPWVVTPTPDTDPAALEVVRGLSEAVEARWLMCDPQAHDRAVAMISHLPVLVGAALLQAADRGATAAPASGAGPAGDGEGDAQARALVRALASSGFADTTRVGGGNPELGALMARCNREQVLAALTSYRRSLDQLEGLLQQERWADLHEALSACQHLRPEFL